MFDDRRRGEGARKEAAVALRKTTKQQIQVRPCSGRYYNTSAALPTEPNRRAPITCDRLRMHTEAFAFRPVSSATNISKR
jgi:soluble lytic murein transglycosylase-like protein